MKQVNIPILDDIIPEDTESLKISLNNPTGGASLSDSDQSVIVNILSNDNAHGTVQFSRVSMKLMIIHIIQTWISNVDL